MSEIVLVERRGEAAIVSLNRPAKRNAITLPMLVEIGQAVSEGGKQAGVRAVLVRGNGAGFAAGIDLNAFSGADPAFGPDWRDRMLDITHRFQDALGLVSSCAVPTIALLHRFVLGLGLELALACDLRIAAEGTQLGWPETRLGLIPDVGGTTRLTRLVGPARAKQMIFTGSSVAAATAASWGLVNEVVPQSSLLQQGPELAAEIAGCAPLAVSAAKRVIDQLGEDVAAGLVLEAQAQNELVKTKDFAAAGQAMATKSTPRWQGR
jgi:enoyl-CoA hydratase/carnithine racemase